MRKRHNSIITAVTCLNDINQFSVLVKQLRFQPDIFPSKLTFVRDHPNYKHCKIASIHPKINFGTDNSNLILIWSEITLWPNQVFQKIRQTNNRTENCGSPKHCCHTLHELRIA